jgi:acyl-[acyl-carrier-protein] desaturase
VIDDHTILRELTPTVGRLVDRHLANAKEWFPHEYVPWSLGRDFEAGECWSEDQAPMAEEVRAALVVNLLTEDNLPHYFRAIDHVVAREGGDGPWAEWSRRWTAEEGRHSIVIRDYLTVTRAVDPVALERGRMAQVSHGWASPFHTITDLLAYTTLQELATRVSHSNTGRLLGDDHGRKLMARVAGDEALHHVFYRDAMLALIELDASAAVIAIDRTVREFAMPGIAIENFAHQARAIANAGIYNFSSHHASVLVPVVIDAWHVDELTGLSGEAEAARTRCLAHIDRVGRVGRRIQERRKELASAH